jgi:environmental stress-induced protein Ves
MEKHNKNSFRFIKNKKIQKWSGGITTQLYIFPENADYNKSNYLFRISTATVEAESSTFTKLLGISRILLILDGSIEIHHENKYKKPLDKFDTDEFEGDWGTSAIGKCTDFNIMTRKSTKSELFATIIKKDEKYSYSFKSKFDFLFLYVYAGELEIYFENNKQLLKKGDFIEINNNIELLNITTLDNSEIVISKIKL